MFWAYGEIFVDLAAAGKESNPVLLGAGVPVWGVLDMLFFKFCLVDALQEPGHFLCSSQHNFQA